jgi:hypothetical protein
VKFVALRQKDHGARRAIRCGARRAVVQACEDLTESLALSDGLRSLGLRRPQPWSIWTMNVTSYCGPSSRSQVEYLLAQGYRPPRLEPSSNLASRLSYFAILTLIILAFCLMGALNARATYHAQSLSFDYSSSMGWLLSTFDRAKTWQASGITWPWPALFGSTIGS